MSKINFHQNTTQLNLFPIVDVTNFKEKMGNFESTFTLPNFHQLSSIITMITISIPSQNHVWSYSVQLSVLKLLISPQQWTRPYLSRYILYVFHIPSMWQAPTSLSYYIYLIISVFVVTKELCLLLIFEICLWKWPFSSKYIPNLAPNACPNSWANQVP